ncbi:MAG TPA: gliding motility protein GldM [Bacteroidales bacterium]|nr:gliding motility protein GldM [Bacteroidales bacterium]
MAHGKETPRQKMIGMMYLVLTALLALNVSKDILNAFVLVEGGLSKTTENFVARNQIVYDQFSAMAISNPTKVKPWQDKALEVKSKADSLFNYIQQLKIEIIKKAEGQDTKAVEGKKINGELIEAKDNTDIPAEIMYGSNNSGKGKDLKRMIEGYREFLIGLTSDPEIVTSLKHTLDTSNPPAKEGLEARTWESEHFEGLPLIAVATIMAKMQGDVRNAESEIIQHLISQIEAGSFKFNKLEPTVIPNSNYVIRGNEYKAEVFLAASDTTQRPSIYVGQVERIKTADGRDDYRMVGRYDSLAIDPKTNKGIFKRPAGTLGTMKWGGLIQLKATDGSYIKRPFTAEYQVAEANAVVSPTKMNVLYIGVDNPISISVSGIPSDRIFATSTNGIIRRSGNSWVAIPRQPGNALIEVVADVYGDGKKKSMGAMEFRVKNIPDPIGKVAGRKGGAIDKGTLAAQMVVNADLEGFEFDAKFTVTEFTVSALVRGFNQEEISKSFKITSAQRDIISNLKKGEKVYFDNIKAVGPDGKPRELPTISFKIQ